MYRYNQGEARRVRSNRYYRLYGITLEDYETKLKDQDYCCLICGVKQSVLKYPLHVDHCHSTREIRGLLCNKCNQAVGWYENIKLMKAVKQYLERYKEIK